MSDPNPYASPDVDKAYEKPAADAASQFSELDDKKFNKLYYRSCNISGIAVILMLGAMGILFFAVKGGGGAAILWGIELLYVLTITGLILRTSWGRVLGLFVCTLMVILGIFGINILAIAIGTAGLFAMGKCPQLFGEYRVKHKELKDEFKRRKLAKKLAKQAAKA